MVHEQQVVPLLLALGTLTAALCRDPQQAKEIAGALRMQAESCPPDISGKTYLLSLAHLAEGGPQADPASAARAVLRLVRTDETEE